MVNLFALIFVLTAANLVTGAKILLASVNVNSHVLYVTQFGVALAAENHDVTVLLPSSVQTPDFARNYSGLEVIHYPVSRTESALQSKEMSEAMIKSALADGFFVRMQALMNVSELMIEQFQSDCTDLFQNKELFGYLKSQQYAFAVFDLTDLFCSAYYPYALEVPYGFISIPSAPTVYRVPTIPSVYPTSMLSFTENMSFLERLQNTLALVVGEFSINSSTYNVETFVAHRPPITPVRLYQEASLWFILEDISVSYPFPYMPNVVSVGDVMARPAKQLPADIQNFLDNANETGVVVMSFGSFFDHMPDDILKEICETVKHVSQKVIWKLKDPAKCSIPGDKGKIIGWIPQNDILAHRNVKLFVTHGGLNSMIESIYHAVPLVVLPLSLDQPYNAEAIGYKQLGIHVDIKSLTEEKLSSAIRHVTEEIKFKENVIKASSLLRKKPSSVGKRASFAINHVIKYGDHHLRSKSYEMNILQFLLFDISFFLFLCLIILVLMLLFIVYFAFKCCKIILRKGFKMLGGKSKSKKE